YNAKINLEVSMGNSVPHAAHTALGDFGMLGDKSAIPTYNLGGKYPFECIYPAPVRQKAVQLSCAGHSR
ncbi:hypothetical protein, partial [Haematospirillum jordaniae]